MKILPAAKPSTIEMFDRTYFGANPKYTPVQAFNGGPVHYVKTEKGTPYRRVG